MGRVPTIVVGCQRCSFLNDYASSTDHSQSPAIETFSCQNPEVFPLKIRRDEHRLSSTSLALSFLVSLLVHSLVKEAREEKVARVARPPPQRRRRSPVRQRQAYSSPSVVSIVFSNSRSSTVSELAQPLLSTHPLFSNTSPLRSWSWLEMPARISR